MTPYMNSDTDRSSDAASRNRSSATRSVTLTQIVSVRLPSSAMTYADVVEPLTAALLVPLRAARFEVPPAALAVVYRPLGAALLWRLTGDRRVDCARFDPRAVASATAMLAGWLEACVDDPTPVPADCTSARAVLRAFLEQHWPALR